MPTGRGGIDSRLSGYARAGAGSPWLVLRDLDRDAPCAPAWRAKHEPKPPGRFFALRMAVRAVEAWFLADTEAAARSLHVGVEALPVNPDAELDPKKTIVALARRSTKPAIKNGLVPKPGISRPAGPDYGRWFIVSAKGWSLERALPRSESLRRALTALRALREDWERAERGEAWNLPMLPVFADQRPMSSSSGSPAPKLGSLCSSPSSTLSSNSRARVTSTPGATVPSVRRP